MRRIRALVAVAAATIGVAACTGVPTSSSPRVIQSIDVREPAANATITPTPGADPREIVREFLAANVTDDTRHGAARGFLTPEAKNHWTDNTATIVNTRQIGNFTPADNGSVQTNGTVTVRGQVMGSLGGGGIYTPVLQGDGDGGPAVSFSYVMKRVAGEWRIDTLPPGLLLEEQDFQRVYQQRNLYFYDVSGTDLVADPRYTALIEPVQLASWLVQQLVSGPRPELQNVAGQLGGLAQTDPRRVSVSAGQVLRIEIPGSSQLDGATLDHLAAQVAITLQQVGFSQTLTITDSSRAVTIPAAHGVGFTASIFPPLADVPQSSLPVYYVSSPGRRGLVRDEHGRPLPGGLGNGQYGLTSVALARDGASDLYAAGVTGSGSNERLLVGTQNHGLQPTPAHGALSRPSWAPGLNEVWIGVGAKIVRVGADGKPIDVTVTPISGVETGAVRALRLSPDGSRIAVVLKNPGSPGQLWIGSIVRSTGGAVRVDSLEQISPQGIDIVDAAWYGSLKLFTVGSPAGTSAPGVYEVQVDGALWTPSTTTGLPQAADSITVANNQFAWVSAGGTVWKQPSGQWVSPNGAITDGTNPVYLE